MSVSKSGRRNAIWKAPTIFFHSVVWFERVMFSVMETAGLVCSCVADVSGNDEFKKGFFSFNLKGSIFKRGTDCTFLHLRIFLVMNTRIHYIP